MLCNNIVNCVDLLRSLMLKWVESCFCNLVLVISDVCKFCKFFMLFGYRSEMFDILWIFDFVFLWGFNFSDFDFKLSEIIEFEVVCVFVNEKIVLFSLCIVG